MAEKLSTPQNVKISSDGKLTFDAVPNATSYNILANNTVIGNSEGVNTNMVEKTLKTRIQLRFDTYDKWAENNPVLKKGEVAVVQIDTKDPANKLLPPIMFKVGTGETNASGEKLRFKDLGWTSALAADVYDWAKKSGIETTVSGSGSFVSGVSWDDTNNKLLITKSNVSGFVPTTRTIAGKALSADISADTLRTALGIESGATKVTETTVSDWGFTKNKGTVTGIKMNNASKTVGSDGTVDLGTVITDVSGKQDKLTAGSHISISNNTISATWPTSSDSGYAGIDKVGTVTGVSLASGTNNGTVKLTVNGTATDNIAVKGLAAAAYKAVDTAVTANSANLITSGGVKTYVDTAVAGVVKYMGTVADATALAALVPDSKGDFCRASAAFKMTAALSATGAEIQVHASDMLVCEAVNGKDSATATTYSIIHGEIDTNTWTANAVNAAGYVSAPTTSNKNKVWKTDGNGNPGWRTDENTTYSAGTGLSISGTTINHSNSITAGAISGDANKTLTFGGTFKIPKITYDAQGHITKTETTTMTMPSNPNTNQTVKVGDTTFGANTAVAIAAGSHTSVTAANNTITIAATWPTASDSGYAGINKTGTVTTVSAASGSGLKITGTASTTPTIDWDSSVTLVFDCGDSTDV